jgi:hypothetical protein
MGSRVSALSRRSHTLAAWIAVVAVVLHALLPGLARVQTGPLALMAEVCSSIGAKKVSVSQAPGTTPSSPDHAVHSSACAVCSLASAVALPPSLDQWFFSALQAVAPPLIDTFVSHSSSLVLPAPRGPPLES